MVDILGLRLHGRPAAWIWRLLYVGKLIGFRNKVRVTTDRMLNRFFGRDTSLLEPSRRPDGSLLVDATGALDLGERVRR